MIPIKNKKKTLEATVEEMRNFSFTYIEKYAPSKQQLKTYLLKKYIKTKTHFLKEKILIAATSLQPPLMLYALLLRLERD